MIRPFAETTLLDINIQKLVESEFIPNENIYVSIHDVVDNRLLATQMNLSFAMSENLFLQHSFMKPSDLNEIIFLMKCLLNL